MTASSNARLPAQRHTLTRLTVAVAAAAAALMVGTATFAAADAASAPPAGMPGMHQGHRGQMGQQDRMGRQGRMGERGAMDPAAMATRHLEQMKTRLAITTAQEPAWKAFADKVEAQGQAMKAMHEQHQKADAAKLTAPERMAQHTEAMTQRLAGHKEVDAAFKDLYAQLSPEQRAKADKMAARMGHGRGGMMGMMEGPGPMGHGKHQGMDHGQHRGMGGGMGPGAGTRPAAPASGN